MFLILYVCLRVTFVPFVVVIWIMTHFWCKIEHLNWVWIGVLIWSWHILISSNLWRRHKNTQEVSEFEGLFSNFAVLLYSGWFLQWFIVIFCSFFVQVRLLKRWFNNLGIMLILHKKTDIFKTFSWYKYRVWLLICCRMMEWDIFGVQPTTDLQWLGGLRHLP